MPFEWREIVACALACSSSERWSRTCAAAMRIAAACVERAEDLAATFDAYTAAETPWRLAAALDTAGPRPADPVEFAIWCAAISRPPPPLGSGFDVRPSLLEALDGVSRLVIAEHGLRRALAERQGDDVTAFGEPPRLPEYVRADLSS